MVSIDLKSCDRCQTGDMQIDRDEFGPYRSCFQCGNMQYLTVPEQEKSLRSVDRAKNLSFSARHIRLPYVGDMKNMSDRWMSVRLHASNGGTSASKWVPMCVFCGCDGTMQSQGRTEYQVVLCPKGHRPYITLDGGAPVGWR